MKRLIVQGAGLAPLALWVGAAALCGCDKEAPRPQAHSEDVGEGARVAKTSSAAEEAGATAHEDRDGSADNAGENSGDGSQPQGADAKAPGGDESAQAPARDPGSEEGDVAGETDKETAGVEDGETAGAKDSETLVAEWAPFDASKLMYLPSEDGPFTSFIEEKGPRLARVFYPNGEVENAFGNEHETSGTVMLTAKQVTDLKVEKPKAVWMFGSDGPCRAKIKKPYATVMYDAGMVIETGFFLEACTTDYAPVAYVGKKPPPAKWHSATPSFDEIVKKPKSFKHPGRKLLVDLGLLDTRHTETKKKAVTHVRIREAGPVTEFGVMQHWPHPEDCEEEASGGVVPALWDHKSPPQRLDPGDEYDQPELVGSLTLDGKVAAIIYDESFNMYVQTKNAYTEVLTGDYHDEDVAYWGWSVLDGYCGP